MAFACAPLDALEEEAALREGETTFKFIMSEHSVPEPVQARVLHSGVTSLRNFVNLADTKAEMRAIFQAHFALDPTYNINQRIWASSLLTVWEVAKLRLDSDDKCRYRHYDPTSIQICAIRSPYLVSRPFDSK